MGTQPGTRAPSLIALGVVGGLLVAAVISPVIAAGTLTKKTVKKTATKLDRQIATRVGYAFDSTDNRALDAGASGGAIQQLTTSVTAPSPGFLVLDLWMDSQNYTNPEFFRCSFRVDGTNVQSSEVGIMLDNAIDPDGNCISHAVVPVNSGNHAVALVTEEVDYGTTHTDEIGLSAMYVPFNGTGARPANFTVAKGR